MDFSESRGFEPGKYLFKQLDWNPAGTFLRLVFTSHRGAGKSTELNRLAKRLDHKYSVIYLETNVELHSTTIEFEDLMLLLALRVEAHMRETVKKPLPKETLVRVAQWFAETIKTTSVGTAYQLETKAGVDLKAGVFAKLMFNLTALFKAESTHKEEVKETLKKFPGALLDAVNKLLDAANELLKESGKRLLIITDNMDHYNPVVIDDMITRNADRLKELRCDFILTPPISLIYRPQSETLDQNYKCFVMPTVKLRGQNDGYAVLRDPGLSQFLGALNKRMNVNKLIPDEDAQKRLVWASGGAIRSLMEIVQDATLEADDVIGAADVERVIKRRQQRLRDRMNANGLVEVLRRIGRNKQLYEDPKCLDVLYQRLAFMYNDLGWYDIHPMLADLPELEAPE